MFYTLTRKSVIVTTVIIIASILPLAIGAAAIMSSPEPAYTIVIDAGHGGIDGGVSGVNTGVSESELNLAVAKLLSDLLEEAEFNVVMTRTNSDGLYGDKSDGFKRRDMAARKNIILSSNADMVISVHMNFYASYVRRGLQVFYSDTGESLTLAKEIQKVVNYNINLPVTGRNLRELYGDYYILKCAPVPSVIVECGFLSNPEDEKLLTDPEYQSALAYYIFSGIVSYLNCYAAAD